MSDFYRVRDVRGVLEVDRNNQSASGEAGLKDMLSQLHEEKTRRLRLRAAIGDLRQSANFLEQLHHFYFRSHTVNS